MASTLHGSPASLIQLKKKWGYLLVISLGLWVAGYLYLHSGWAPVYAYRWLVIAGVVFGYLLVTVRSTLNLNHLTHSTELLPDYGPGNLLTISRGVLLALFAGFVFSPQPRGWMAWIPPALYWSIAIMDLLDGYAARVSGQVTRMGEALDLRLDGVGVLAATLLAIGYRQVPVWYLLVGLARYLFVAGIYLWEKSGRRPIDLPESYTRRALAGVQMGFIGVMLLPIFSPPGTIFAATVFMIPFTFGFAIDFLMVLGFWTSDVTRKIGPVWKQVKRILPPLMRIITLGLLVWLLFEQRTEILVRELGNAGFSSIPVMGVLVVLEGICLLLITLGVLGRVAALGVMLLMGFLQMLAPLTAVQYLLVASAAGLFYAGTGPASLWAPENTLIYSRAGERSR